MSSKAYSYKQTQPCDKLRCMNAASKSGGIQYPHFQKWRVHVRTHRTPKLYAYARTSYTSKIDLENRNARQTIYRGNDYDGA